jgi:hypothetical protein
MHSSDPVGHPSPKRFQSGHAQTKDFSSGKPKIRHHPVRAPISSRAEAGSPANSSLNANNIQCPKQNDLVHRRIPQSPEPPHHSFTVHPYHCTIVSLHNRITSTVSPQPYHHNRANVPPQPYRNATHPPRNPRPLRYPLGPLRTTNVPYPPNPRRHPSIAPTTTRIFHQLLSWLLLRLWLLLRRRPRLRFGGNYDPQYPSL